MAFGQVLKRMRDERGLSQREVARRAHVSVTTVSNWERWVQCRARGSTFRKIASVLGTTPAEIDRAVREEEAMAHGTTGAPNAVPVDLPAEDWERFKRFADANGYVYWRALRAALLLFEHSPDGLRGPMVRADEQELQQVGQIFVREAERLSASLSAATQRGLPEPKDKPPVPRRPADGKPRVVRPREK